MFRLSYGARAWTGADAVHVAPRAVKSHLLELDGSKYGKYIRTKSKNNPQTNPEFFASNHCLTWAKAHVTLRLRCRDLCFPVLPLWMRTWLMPHLQEASNEEIQ